MDVWLQWSDGWLKGAKDRMMDVCIHGWMDQWGMDGNEKQEKGISWRKHA